MAGPGDEVVAGAGGRGRLRASHADREQVIEVLKAAFVQGRLDRDEFDLRVGRALASRTHADLATLTADLPGRPARAQPRSPRGNRRARGSRQPRRFPSRPPRYWACSPYCRRSRRGRLLPY